MGLKNFTAANRKPNLVDFALLTNTDLSFITSNLTAGSAPVRGALSPSPDGVAAAFTLPATPASDSLALILRNGIAQVRNTAYTISGATVTFAAGYIPQTGDLLEAFIWS